MSEQATGTKGSIVGVQMTVFGFFVAWAFQQSTLSFIGSLLVLAGTVVVLFNTFYR